MYHMKLREILKDERSQKIYNLAIDNMYLENCIKKMKEEAEKCSCKKMYQKYYIIKSENLCLIKDIEDLKQKCNDLDKENSDLEARIKILEKEKLEIEIQKHKIQDKLCSFTENFQVL